MKPGQTCGTCAYWDENPGIPNGGFCHADPPTVFITVTKNGPVPVASSHTFSLLSDWCGRWEKGNVVRVVSKIN